MIMQKAHFGAFLDIICYRDITGLVDGGFYPPFWRNVAYFFALTARGQLVDLWRFLGICPKAPKRGSLEPKRRAFYKKSGYFLRFFEKKWPKYAIKRQIWGGLDLRLGF